MKVWKFLAFPSILMHGVRHSAKSPREISANFGQFREIVSRREMSEFRVKNNRKSKNTCISHILRFCFPLSDVYLEKIEQKNATF